MYMCIYIYNSLQSHSSSKRANILNKKVVCSGNTMRDGTGICTGRSRVQAVVVVANSQHDEKFRGGEGIFGGFHSFELKNEIKKKKRTRFPLRSVSPSWKRKGGTKSSGQYFRLFT